MNTKTISEHSAEEAAAVLEDAAKMFRAAARHTICVAVYEREWGFDLFRSTSPNRPRLRKALTEAEAAAEAALARIRAFSPESMEGGTD